MTSDPLVARIASSQRAARERAARLRALLPEAERLLRARGATRVICFGSLATGADPHADTDVDLCVWGMEDDARAEALFELEALFGATVDLAAWERASPRLQAAVIRDGREIRDVAA